MEIDSDSDEEEPAPKKPPARSPAGGKTLRRPGGGKTLRKPLSDDDDDDDDEEEIVAPSKRPTRSSAAAAAKKIEADDMEESEDESSDEELELEDGALQSLVKDDTDQKYLDSLPEIEREAILGERFEKRKAEVDMKKALKEAK
jgi:RNA polymerase-associated protein RTF1